MSLISDFELGLWNAWVFTVLFYVASLIPFPIYKEKLNMKMKGEPAWDGGDSRTMKILFLTSQYVIIPFTIVYSIFLPLKVGTAWFYAGALICSLGTAMVLMAGVSFATAALDEPMTKGVYSISRNPMYFGMFLLFAGIGVSCASWVFVLCAAVWIIACHFGVRKEERFLLETYGNAYREYMNRTPRWIGMPKSKRK